MLKEYKKLIRSQSGFSLIEIMVVMAIIGSLLGLVAVKVMSSLDESKVETTKMSIKNTEAALQMYKRKVGSYPSTEQGLAALKEKPTTGKVPESYPPEGFLSKVPQDGWGNEFVYTSPGSAGNPYEIISYGEDGEEGGEEYAADLKSYELK